MGGEEGCYDGDGVIIMGICGLMISSPLLGPYNSSRFRIRIFLYHLFHDYLSF